SSAWSKLNGGGDTMKERYIVRCTKLARIVKYLYSIRDIYWAKHLASLEVQTQGSRFSVKSRELCIDAFDLCLSWGKHAFFLSGLRNGTGAPSSHHARTEGLRRARSCLPI